MKALQFEAAHPVGSGVQGLAHTTRIFNTLEEYRALLFITGVHHLWCRYAI